MYDNLKECVQGRQLVNSLDNDALDIIESVLEAHNQGKIDFKIIDNSEFELIVNDDSYCEMGTELLILEWYYGYEDTSYLISCFS